MLCRWTRIWHLVTTSSPADAGRPLLALPESVPRGIRSVSYLRHKRRTAERIDFMPALDPDQTSTPRDMCNATSQLRVSTCPTPPDANALVGDCLMAAECQSVSRRRGKPLDSGVSGS